MEETLQNPNSAVEAVPASPSKIKTHGIELVLAGIVVFISIIFLTMVSYNLFIKERVKDSAEYNTATYFVVNSQTLKEQLLAPMISMQFDDLHVSEKADYGICEVTFLLELKNGVVEKLKLGLIKVADFWLVYDAVLSPDTPAAYPLASTYQKILALLDSLSYQSSETARVYLDMIQEEVRDPNLYEYLAARVNAVSGNTVYAAQLLDDLKARVDYAKLAVMYERALVNFSREEFQKSVDLFEEIIAMYKEINAAKTASYNDSFSKPKDPLFASFNHDNVIAETYQNLALSYYQLGEFEKGLGMAEEALKFAEKIESSVVRSASLFVRALNLYKLGRLKDADKAFIEVISDVYNANLSQKAWAYFYRAEIAHTNGRPADSLDFYEMAVGLDPYNYLLREGTIKYLITRNYVGDVEIALSMAIRGIQYGQEKQRFRDLAAAIYKKSGLRDQSSMIE